MRFARRRRAFARRLAYGTLTTLLLCGVLFIAPDVKVKEHKAEARLAKRSYVVGNRQAVLDVAYSYLGAPYQLGGLDCSGFTSTVYSEAAGVYLPDDPALQFSYGYPTARLAPGDLVFFDEHGYGITHVGIYTGNGTVIHSSNWYMAVVETNIGYLDGYVGARRIL